jgi:hypothetical protein
MRRKLAFVTLLPTWTVYALGFGSPTLTAVIAITGHYLNHRATQDLEGRSKREEVMRNLRWAAELAASNDAAKARLGVHELKALRESKMLTAIDQGFVDAALRATIQIPREAIAESAEDPEVVVEASANASRETLVSSEEGDMGEEAAS